MEERLARIEGILEQIDKRLNHIESDLIRLDNRTDKLDDKIDRSALIPMWVTIILTILLT